MPVFIGPSRKNPAAVANAGIYRAVARRNAIDQSRRYRASRLTAHIIGFPEKMIAKLSYNETVTLSSISGSFILRGNSVFDPNFTGGGNQPNYFDNYAAIYQKYRVLSSTLTVRFLNVSSTIGCRIMIMPSDSQTPPTNVMNSVGNPYTKQTILGINTSSRNLINLKQRMSTAKLNGKSKAAIMASDSYESGVGTNPTDPWFWIIQYEDLGLASACNIIADVKVVYNVQFTDKANQNLS